MLLEVMQFLGNKLGKNGDGPSNVWKVGEVRRLDIVVVKCAAKEDTSAGPSPSWNVFYLSCSGVGARQALPGSDKQIEQDNVEIKWHKIMEAWKNMKQTRCHGKKWV